MYRRIAYLALFLVALPASADVAAYFSPFDRCERVVLKELFTVQKTCLISCYGLTNQPITMRLIELHRRGIIVIVCVDKLQAASRSDQTRTLKAAGIAVIIKPSSTLEHNKLMVLDNERVITGSWNFSASADKQDNTLLVITHDAPTVQAFASAWKRIFTRDGGKPDQLPASTNP
jgi:phosphatidylserine/phosphatidylglycerophosphate/cardiolipin synthase-like enzyme